MLGGGKPRSGPVEAHRRGRGPAGLEGLPAPGLEGGLRVVAEDRHAAGHALPRAVVDPAGPGAAGVPDPDRPGSPGVAAGEVGALAVGEEHAEQPLALVARELEDAAR